MDFEQEFNQLKDTLAVVTEVQRRQAEVQKMQAEGMALHEKRMNHIALVLSQATHKLNRLRAQ
jgi:hypothetical protein